MTGGVNADFVLLRTIPEPAVTTPGIRPCPQARKRVSLQGLPIE